MSVERMMSLEISNENYFDRATV